MIKPGARVFVACIALASCVAHDPQAPRMTATHPCSGTNEAGYSGLPIAHFNHVYAVLDEATAHEISNSEYLRGFGSFRVKTVHADGGDSWTGRYLTGRNTYVEFFGPRDVDKEERVGATGIAFSPDRAGGIQDLAKRLTDLNVQGMTSSQRSVKIGGRSVPWFQTLLPPGKPDSLSFWVMEYVPEYFVHSQSPRPQERFEGDVSRQRYNANTFRGGPMQDLTLVELASTSQDVERMFSVLKSAGLVTTRSNETLCAYDQATTLIVHSVPLEQVGIRRIEFVLSASAPVQRIERIGRSRLIVGPGPRAVWLFEP